MHPSNAYIVLNPIKLKHKIISHLSFEKIKVHIPSGFITNIYNNKIELNKVPIIAEIDPKNKNK